MPNQTTNGALPSVSATRARWKTSQKVCSASASSTRPSSRHMPFVRHSHAHAQRFCLFFEPSVLCSPVRVADIISTVEFDHTGDYLATGDKGGRVVLFERNEQVCEFFHRHSRSMAPSLNRRRNEDASTNFIQRCVGLFCR